MIPKVQVTILARDREKELDLFLQCVDNIDYDPKRLVIYIHTNNNTDLTYNKLLQWSVVNKDKFQCITFVSEHISELDSFPVRTCENDWYADGGIRLSLLGEIRNKSLRHAVSSGCDYYFICDSDDFFPPEMVKYLVKQDKPIIGPVMMNQSGSIPNSAFFALTPSGYWASSPIERPFFSEEIKGVIEATLVHICYMVRCADAEPLSYSTDGVQMEFVHFARRARDAGVKMFATNEVVGLLAPSGTYEENIELTRSNGLFNY